jgi:hypothetical protein
VTVNMITKPNEHYGAHCTCMASMRPIKVIKEKLTVSQQEAFRKTCFGHFLDMHDLLFPSQLIHNILLREVETVGLQNEMWFLVSGMYVIYTDSE